MTVTKNQHAAALYSGSIGAYLESSTRRIDQIQDQRQLCACRDWLVEHNPLFARYAPHERWMEDDHDIHRPFPVMEPSDREEIRPMNCPDLILNPMPYHPETRDEDFHYTRLPEARIADQDHQWLGKADPNLEPLLFPWLFPYGRGHWCQPTVNEPERFYHDTLGRDVKKRLNSVISHFRDDHYWPAWSYMRIEERRIFQNSNRLISAQKKKAAPWSNTNIRSLSQKPIWTISNFG